MDGDGPFSGARLQPHGLDETQEVIGGQVGTVVLPAGDEELQHHPLFLGVLASERFNQ